MSLSGQTALVTGGSRGIGKAIAARLARDGARVITVARDRSRLESAIRDLKEAGLEVTGIPGDMTDLDDIKRVVEEVTALHGRLDILVNNAATADSAPFLDMTREQWNRVIDSNLSAPFFTAQAAARVMVEGGGGVIVNISSVSAHGADVMANYSAAKSGLHSLTRDIATELASQGVRAVTITPGWVETELVVEHTDAAMLDLLRKGFVRVPMKRLLKTEEIAGAVAYAVSDDASGMTGNEIVIDGGVLASNYIVKSLS